MLKSHPYSTLKAAWHIDRIQSMRNRETIVPVEIQMILSDFCNQDCHWCLAKGTIIDTVHGEKPIESVSVGDIVLDADGGVSRVTETSKRRVDTVIEMQAGSKTIRCSKGHPILTERGFVVARKLTVEDHVIVCVPVSGKIRGETVYTHNGREWSFEKQPISSVRKIERQFDVYNFSCEPSQTYIANGIAVHNCAYRASNGLSSKNFGIIENGEWNHNPNRMIPPEKAREIIRDAASLGVKSVIWTGGGEPTVFPGHLDIFKESMDLGLDASLNTNGAVFRDGWRDVFPRMAYVRFSVDAANANDYARDRHVSPAQYNTVLTNMKSLTKEVCSQQSECVVGAGYVVTPRNWSNVIEGVGRIKDTGVQYVRMASMQSTLGVSAYHGDTWKWANEEVQKAKAIYEDESFSVISMTEEAMGGRPDYQLCGFQHFVTYIAASLKIFRCCYTAHTDIGEIGSLENQSFSEWIKSEQCKRELWEFDAKRCVTCPLDGKNRTILYMINSDPLHVNFV